MAKTKEMVSDFRVQIKIMKLELDLSKLSPTTRREVISSLRDILWKHSGEISYDLKEWTNKNSDAYNEMFQWSEEAARIAKQVTAFSKDNKL